jgi:hypothetical protein
MVLKMVEYFVDGSDKILQQTTIQLHQMFHHDFGIQGHLHY